MAQSKHFLTVIGQPPGEQSRAMKYDPENCMTVRMLAQEGQFPEEWAAHLGVSLETMRLWCQTYPDFYDAVGVARILLATYWTRHIKKNLNNPNAKVGLYQTLVRRIPALYGSNPIDLAQWMQTPPDATAPGQDASHGFSADQVANASTEALQERLEALRRRRQEDR